jgi:hypothetical protein
LAKGLPGRFPSTKQKQIDHHEIEKHDICHHEISTAFGRLREPQRIRWNLRS